MFLIIFFALFATSSAFLQQSVGVKGQLLCGNEPLAGAKVKLINHNTIGFDDQLAAAETDEAGNYVLTGGMGALLSLDVRMKIYTSCNTAALNPCDREITLGIPDSFVTRTDAVETYFNGGNMNMQFKFHDEESKCL